MKEHPASVLKVIWIAIRPRTLTLAFAPVLLGTVAAQPYGIRPDALILTLLSAALIQAGTNVYNDYADFHRGADAYRHGPVRITQKGMLQPRQVLLLSVALMAASMLAGIWLVVLGGWPILIIGLCGILLGFGYTGGPFPLAYTGLADFVVWGYFGPIAVAGTSYLHTGQWLPQAWWLGSAIGLPAVAVLVVNNYRDRVQDARVQKKTLAVRFGASFSRLQYASCVLGAPLVLAFSPIAGFGETAWVAGLAVLPAGIVLVRRLLQNEGADLNPVLGQTVGYTMLLACIVAGAMVIAA